MSRTLNFQESVGFAMVATVFFALLATAPFYNAAAQEKEPARSVESKALHAWFVERLCYSIERGRESGKRFRNEKYLVRYCDEYKSLPPARLIPSVIVAEFPADSEYPVAPGILACDVPAGEENTCGLFASVCQTGLNGTGWCEENEDGSGTCWCEYDPASLD